LAPELGDEATVESADEVAEGAESVVVLVDRVLADERLFALAWVAVELGFLDQIGATRAVDSQAAGAESCRDGGDAEAYVVDAFADFVAGAAELFHFGAAGRVGVPHHSFGERLGVLVEGRLSEVALFLDPQHIVLVEDAPDCREWISPSPIDAADGL